jgi:carboxypeptidase Taq
MIGTIKEKSRFIAKILEFIMDHAEPSAYELLKRRFFLLSNLNGAASILSKDAETAMARGSLKDRSEQSQALAFAQHHFITDPLVLQWLEEAEKERETLSLADQRNLTLMRRHWVEASSLSEELALDVARLESDSDALHTELRPTGDWEKMGPWVKRSFDIMRQVGEAKRKALPGFASAYEALLDSFSPELREDDVAKHFDVLWKALPRLIADARAKQAAEPKPLPLVGPFPAEQKLELYRRLIEVVGFDFNRGRFDVIAAHPSSGGTPDDCRISARPDGDDWLHPLYAAAHETGHAIYSQNLPLDWRYQPAGRDLGISMHESQSRIIEVQACHTSEFFIFLETVAREIFKRPDDPALAAANLERLANNVEPSFIRVSADEITYPAHVMLRYRIERALIEGTMNFDDLPKVWNESMHELLGITPPNPTLGHMQDIHWPIGLVGYFPAYTLGDMGAAQLFNAACTQNPGLRPALAKGDFAPLRNWLKENVHSKGSLLTFEDIYRHATGEPLHVRHYLNHLSQRYLGRRFKNELVPG